MGCSVCGKFRSPKKLAVGKFCDNCFTEKFGQVIIFNKSSFYFGGDSNYQRSKIVNTLDQIYLTDQNFIYYHSAIMKSKRWDMIIPFDSIVLDYWDSDVSVIPYKDKDGKMQKPNFTVAGAYSKSGNIKKTKEFFVAMHNALVDYLQKKRHDEPEKTFNVDKGIEEEKGHDLEESEISDESIQKNAIQVITDKLKNNEITIDEFTKAVKEIKK